MRVPLLLSVLAAALPAQSRPTIAWQPWTTELFTRAQKEQRLVLLHLGAVWCHWCHVMEHETYEDPGVIALVSKGWLAVKVDQDARPDLANRYQEYGWPATILFDTKGKEIAKLRGYIPAPRMRGFLQAFLDDPTPGPSVAGELARASAPSTDLLVRLDAAYDEQHGAWGRVHKFLDAECLEHELVRAQGGDARATKRVSQSLAAERALLDPVWGGVYRYSDGGTWESPHFEKIIPRHVGDLRCYALAYAWRGDAADLEAARAIRKYLLRFLRSDEGAYFTSQDADLVRGEHAAGFFARDDEGRKKLGIPAIDRHVYARENGLVIEVFAQLHAVTGDREILGDAITAAEWVLAHRALEGGGFRHGERDEAGPYLADTLAMGRAFLALHVVTGAVKWRAHAERAAGFLTRFALDGDAADFDENVQLARFANLLAHATAKSEHRALAERALRWLRGPGLARRGPFVAGLLLAERELASEPLRVTVIGEASDARTHALVTAALRAPTFYKLVEQLDPRDVAAQPIAYPPVDRPTAFRCANGACSAPITDPHALAAKLGGRVH